MLNLYLETCVGVTPSNNDSIHTVQLPAYGTPRRLTRTQNTSRGNTFLDRKIKNDDSFADTFVASQGAVFFRRSHTYPRSFVWRVIGSSRVLEIRCIDVARSEHDLNEAYLTLRFELPDPILPGGVAISDVEGQETLSIFIITGKKVLYTLLLPVEQFRGGFNATDKASWHSRTSVPSSFTIGQPHRLYAHSPYEVYVSFDNGRLQRLSRKAEDDGSEWDQLSFDGKSWGASLRAIVPWQDFQDIPNGSSTLSFSTANAMVASSDSTHLYTICLNHTLRIWNLTTGKLVVSKDLLDRPIRSQDRPTILNPSTPSFIRLFQADITERTALVTYSALEDGQFKFWEMKGGLTDSLKVRDRFPKLNLKPPDPDPSGNTIWTLSGFDVRPATLNDPPEIWVLWRNNNLHRVYSIQFNLDGLEQEDWDRNWVQIRSSPSTLISPPELVVEDSIDPTQKWLKFFFWPGRYSTTVLESSLNIYRESSPLKVPVSTRDQSLQERLCSMIASNVGLRKYSDSELDFGRFASESDIEWRKYWRVVERLNEMGKAPLGLAYDAYSGMALIPQSDQLALIRECNDLELLNNNSTDSLTSLKTVTGARWPHRRIKPQQKMEEVSKFLQTVMDFTQSFSPELSRECEKALEMELFEETDTSIVDRISEFYEKCQFGDAIANETYDKVLSGLDSVAGLDAVGSDIIPAILSLFPDTVQGSQTSLRSTILGSDLIEAGLNQTIFLRREVLFGLLMLIIMVECEADEESRSVAFDASSLYPLLLDLFKENEKKWWLLSHARDITVGLRPRFDSSMDQNSGPRRQATLLMDTTGKDIKPQPAVGSPQGFLITEMLSDIEVWVEGSSEMSSDDSCIWIQCSLLAHGDTEWASDFARFLPNSAWASYIKGRLCLQRNEYEEAASFFQKAAYWAGHGRAIGMLREMSARLLSLEDADHFQNGSRNYFQHIVTLFESAKAYSFAADFARLALAGASDKDEQQEEDGILQSLFTSELFCSNHKAAYSALTKLRSPEARAKGAITWTNAVLGRDSWPGLSAMAIVDLLHKLPLALHFDINAMIDVHLGALAEQQAILPGLSNASWEQEPCLDYLKILYAVRAARKDYRGAVTVLIDRLQVVKRSRQARNDPQAKLYRATLLALINTLSCVAPEEAYVLTTQRDGRADVGVQGDGEMAKSPKSRRVIVTLNDLRREYQGLLDKCSRIERGDFDFDAQSEDEEDMNGFPEAANGINTGDTMEF